MRMPELEHMSKGEILSILPPTMQDIFEVLSREGVIELLDRFAGTRIHLPFHKPPHESSQFYFLTRADFDALFRLSAGCLVWVPTLYSLRQYLRRRNIAALHAQRYSARQIALTLGISDRTVHYYLSGRRGAPPGRSNKPG